MNCSRFFILILLLLCACGRSVGPFEHVSESDTASICRIELDTGDLYDLMQSKSILPEDEIDGKVILSAMEQQTSFEKELLEEAHHHHEHGENCTCGCHDHDHEHHHHHHHADEVFTSWGKETPHKYERETMREILNKLANTEEYGVILRAKGMVPATDGTWIYFDLTPGEFELREGQPDYTGRLCVIGSKIKEDALEALFELA